jgi:ferrochelatase
LAQNGTQHVQVICPGFSVDCLETLEEIDEENRGYFMEAGGAQFSYISALNDRDDHIQALSNIIAQHL